MLQFASLSVNVSCTAANTTTYPIRWSWRNNTALLQLSNNVQFIEEGPLSYLTIDSLSVYDNMTLQCVAYNGNGSAAASSQVTVKSKSLLLRYVSVYGKYFPNKGSDFITKISL